MLPETNLPFDRKGFSLEDIEKIPSVVFLSKKENHTHLPQMTAIARFLDFLVTYPLPNKECNDGIYYSFIL